MHPITVIVNASSGSGQPSEQAQLLVSRFANAGLSAKVRVAAEGEDIGELASAAASQGHVVVAGGGDGTINQVAGALAGSGATLGILPLGTLNHFARDLGIPFDLDQAIAVIAAGHVREVDTGEVNGKLFLNNSSIGLYPQVVLDRERQEHRLGRGKWLAFGWACVSALRRFPFLDVQLQVDGTLLARRTAFVFIGNNSYTMRGLDIGERARLDAGKLSLYTSSHTGRLGLLRLAVRALFGLLEQARDMDVLETTEVAIETRHRQLEVSTDGEVSSMRMPLDYKIRPASLRVIAPPATAAATKE